MPTITIARNNMPFNSQLVVPASVGGLFQIAVSDARVSFSADQTLNQTGVTGVTTSWLSVPPGCTGIEVIGRVPKSTTAVGTNPVLTLWGAIPTALLNSSENTIITADGVPTPGIYVRRLDATDPTSVGTALAFPAAPSTTTAINDSLYYYSAPIFVNTDLRGAAFISVLPTTASDITPTAACEVLVSFLN